jgi:TonB-dependent receptor
MEASPARAASSEDRGSIRGRIEDSNSRALPGATVHVEPGGAIATSDREGFYSVPNLAPGAYKVEVSYLGFVTETQDATVVSGVTVRADFKLNQDNRVTENVVVTASRERGEVEALNEEKNSQNIVDVLPEEVITSLPNANLADAIGRLPSVSLERDEGEGKYVQVRGSEPRMTNVTINGVHIPSVSGSNEGFGRQIKLDAFPSDLVGTVELFKTTSPDQDGDAIGGSVNILTKTAGDEQSYSFSALGGYTDLQGGRPSYQLNGTYSNRFGPDKALGFVLGGTYDWNGRAINDIEPVPAVVTLADGSTTTAFNTMDIRNYRYDRSRYGFAGGLDYRLAENSALYLKGLFTQFQNYGDRWVTTPTAGNFLTPTLTDATGNYSASVQNRRPNEQTYSIAGGGKSDLQTVLLDYVVSYSHARQNRINQEQADFNGPSAAFQVNSNNGYFPTLTPIGVNPLDPSLYQLADYRITDERSAARDIGIALNATIPLNFGSYPSEIKIGGKYRDENKVVTTNDRFFNAIGTYLMSQGIDTSIHDPGYYFGRYTAGPYASLGAVTNYFNQNPGAFEEDTNTEHLQNDPNNFTAHEKVSAGYIMDTTTFGNLQLRFGVRVEHTNAGYTGNQVNLDADGNWISTQPTSGNNSYTNWLPSISLRYALDPNTNLRAVYGWLIGRPDYGDLAPSLFVSDVQRQLNAGNPNLKPTQSRSYDLLFEHFIGTVVVVSVGGFYRTLKDPIYPGSSSIVHGGIYDGFEIIQPINGPSAKIYGAEVAWQQHLSFLPGVLQGLGILANYTYSGSQATFDPSTGRTGTAPLQRNTPHEANFGLTYDSGPFSARAALTYNSATVFVYNYKDGADGGLKGPNGDTYLFPHTQIDLQVSYTLSNGISIVASGLNLNNEVFGFYNGSPQWFIQREYYSPTFSVGVRLNR